MPEEEIIEETEGSKTNKAMLGGRAMTNSFTWKAREIEHIQGEKNLKQKRCLLVTYVDVSDGAETPEWEVLGYGIEDASYEVDFDKETTTDILCLTETDITNVVESINYDPHELHAGNKLQAILTDIFIRGNHNEYTGFKTLTVHAYKGETTYPAVQHDNSTITIERLGGANFIEMPITIDFGGVRTVGTTDKVFPDDPTFTPEA